MASALGTPGRLAIDIQPDGDLLYTPGGFWTAAHHRVPMLIVMVNNRSSGNDEQHQEAMARHRGRPVERKGIGIRIADPPVDFAGLAQRAVRHVNRERRPALVDVVTQPRERLTSFWAPDAFPPPSEP